MTLYTVNGKVSIQNNGALKKTKNYFYNSLPPWAFNREFWGQLIIAESLDQYIHLEKT